MTPVDASALATSGDGELLIHETHVLVDVIEESVDEP